MRVLFVVLVLSALAFTDPAAAQGDQYKRFGQVAMVKIVDGDVDGAIADLQQLLDVHPDDPEFFYVLAVACTQKGDLEDAMDYAQRAVDAGLPIERFLAGPRRLLEPLLESDAFSRWVRRLRPQAVIHGPLLGSVTSRRVQVWVRTASEVPVNLTVKRGERIVGGSAGMTRAGRDHTVVLSLDGLSPDTEYRYVLTVDGLPYPVMGRFRTMPREGQPARFQVGFGGGAGYTPWHERMWTTIGRYGLKAFLMMGDNVYIDHPARPDIQHYTYYRRQSRPEFRALAAGTPIFAIWDDHDFGENDSWGGPEIDEPSWKRDVWRVFKENWNNPAYGGGDEQPGVWFEFSIADVDFFMLDGRNYRTDPTIEDPSMLGPVQKAWLFDRLAASNATFKVIVSPVPWAFGAEGGTQMTPEGPQPGGLDTWEGFPDERETIFSFLEENVIEGVLLLSADRHRSDAWRIERPNGYDLYEFESSRLTNVHVHELIDGALFGYNEKNSFGLLTFDTTRRDPAVTYEIVTIDGEVVGSLTVALSDLSYTH